MVSRVNSGEVCSEEWGLGVWALYAALEVEQARNKPCVSLTGGVPGPAMLSTWTGVCGAMPIQANKSDSPQGFLTCGVHCQCL